MKVVVCVKQTPSTTAVFSVKDGAVSWEDPGGKPNVVNPWDEYAVEEAIKFKEDRGATDAIALCVGDPSSDEALKTCLAMGCTDAVLVSDPALAGSDTLGTARTLAAGIHKIGDVQVALFGKQAIDGDSGHVPVQTARVLGWTPLTYVSAIKSVDGGAITVERLTDDGKETVTAKYQADIVAAVARAKPLRSHFTVGVGLEAAAQLNVIGYIRAGTYNRLQLAG